MERGLVDTVGFAHKRTQMDSLMERIKTYQGNDLESAEASAEMTDESSWKVAISPHDDYTYVGYLYPALLRHIKAKTLYLIGVAHKASNFNLQDKLVFGTFKSWHGIEKQVPVSPLRDCTIEKLPESTYIIHDEMMKVEHSLEGLLPFLQYFNPEIEIIPLLVPYMSFSRVEELAQNLAKSIYECTTEHGMEWGKDFAIVISTDAVHYGDQGWGGRNFAFFGTDGYGYEKAIAHEHEIIRNCLTSSLEPDRIKRFMHYTLEDDYRTYRWTWCGRFSVPMGLMTAYYLQLKTGVKVEGKLLGYHTSIDQEPLPVNDLGMGVTAPANDHHWVGYVAIGYQ